MCNILDRPFGWIADFDMIINYLGIADIHGPDKDIIANSSQLLISLQKGDLLYDIILLAKLKSTKI